MEWNEDDGWNKNVYWRIQLTFPQSCLIFNKSVLTNVHICCSSIFFNTMFHIQSKNRGLMDIQKIIFYSDAL